MDEGALVSEQIEGGARFLGEFEKYAPIKDAFWLKDSEEGMWWLYVASEQITDENFDEGYREVSRLADEFQDPLFDLMRVKLIGADDSLARAAAEMHRRYPGRRPLRFRNESFGGLFAAEGYIYPSPLEVSVKR